MSTKYQDIMNYQSGDSKKIDLSPAKTKMILELTKDQAKYLYSILLKVSIHHRTPEDKGFCDAMMSQHKSLQNRLEDIYFALDKKHNDSIEEIFGKKINDKTLETK